MEIWKNEDVEEVFVSFEEDKPVCCLCSLQTIEGTRRKLGGEKEERKKQPLSR